MKRKRFFISVLFVLILASGIVGYRIVSGSQANTTGDLQTAVIQRGSLSSTLSSSGNTRSGQSATIAWQASGRVGEVTLKPGDVVQADQELAALQADSLPTEIINARSNLIEARQALDDLLNSTLQQAQALEALESAQQSLDGLKRAAAEERSQAQLALAEAQEALKDAQRNRIKMNYPHSTDALVIEKAETDYLLAKQVYKEALKEYNKWAHKKLTNPQRVQALNRLVAAEQDMDSKFATYNWYLQSYTEDDIAQADAELAVAEANLEKAQVEYDRLKDGTSTAAVAMAEATLAEGQRAWERVKDGPSQEDIDAAQAAVDAATATLARAHLVAPFSGTITEVNVKSGDIVSSGDLAFRIDDLASVYIDLQISEVDLPSLKIGQTATLEFDAIPDKVYAGQVTEVGMIGTVSQGVVNYPVTVEITNVDEDIRPGMTASVSIVVDQKEDVLLVPNWAVRTSVGQRTVTVLFEGQQISVPVTIGLTNDTMSEVISEQLREGDVVVINSTNSSTSATGANNRNMSGLGGLGGPVPGGMFP